jgi:hypothetical protein
VITRRNVLVAGGAGVTAAALGGLVAAGSESARSAPSASHDAEVLAFILGIERIEAGFYAAALEDAVVAAYNGQAANLRPETLAKAATIVSVEARHAAWMRHLVGVQPAANAFDEAEGRDAVLTTVASTRFIVRTTPRTTRTRSPRFTG